MFELDIVNFLKTFTTVDEAVAQIKEKYGIHVNAHIDYPNLLQFKYDQIKSPMKKQLCREARGIILDSTDDWKVIAFPFIRFFNNGEHRAANIDWANASIWEKIDGSLMFMYWYDGKWNIASSGLPDASGEVLKAGVTFKDLFWNTWGDLGYDLPPNYADGIDITYIFELSTPENVVVVPQDRHMISFIGARDIVSGDELSIDSDTFPSNWKRPKRFSVTSEEEALKKCNEMNPMEQEGFVIVDQAFNRVKMKSPQYAAIAHLGLTKAEIIEFGLDINKYDESLQQKWMLKVILINECDEFLSYYPQYTEMYKFILSRFVHLMCTMSDLYNEIKHITNQFEYASKVNKHPLSYIFFQLKAGRIESVEEGLRNTDANDVKKLLKILRNVT